MFSLCLRIAAASLTRIPALRDISTSMYTCRSHDTFANVKIVAGYGLLLYANFRDWRGALIWRIRVQGAWGNKFYLVVANRDDVIVNHDLVLYPL